MAGLTPPNFSPTVLCTNIWDSLSNYTGTYQTETITEKTGLIDALLSMPNTIDTKQITFGNSGKYRSVQLFYQPRIPSTDIVTGTGFVPACATPTPQVQPGTSIYDVNNHVTYRTTIADYDVSRICMGDQEYTYKMIMSILNPMLVQVEETILSLYIAQSGQYYDGALTTKLFNLFYAGPPAAIDGAEWSRLIADYEDIGGIGAPIIVGGRRVNEWMKLAQIGCCNNQGVDISMIADQAYYFYSQRMNAIIGANNGFILAPNAVKLLQWCEYMEDENGAGRSYSDYSGSSAVTISHPRNGLKLDMRIFRDFNCKETIIELSTYVDLFTIPADSFTAGDPFFGTNGALRFTTN